MIDKNKLKEKIQKTSSKDILYLTVNPVESKSLELRLKELHNFVGRKNFDLLIIKINEQ